MNAVATLAPPTEGVTHNDSGQVASTVMRNAACCGCEEYERIGPVNGDRRSSYGQLHCKTCHGNSHIACLMCGVCLPPRHRYDRRYCSSTCRVRVHKGREQARLGRSIWEAENPEEARRQAEEYQANVAAMREALQGSPLIGNLEHLKREAELKNQAERCAESDCPNRFDLGDVIYRCRKLITDPVLPYCREHRCTQPDGYHNRDAPEGRSYRACLCEDHLWDDPQPCPGCARLVSNLKNAAWRRVRDWLYADEKPRAHPRPFCSEQCRRRVFRTERKAAQLAARGEDERQCVGCSAEFKGRRRDARYCSVACRQRAYRLRLTGPCPPCRFDPCACDEGVAFQQEDEAGKVVLTKPERDDLCREFSDGPEAAVAEAVGETAV